MMNTNLDKPIIDQIGGEDVVRILVERFYDLIETMPEGANILRLHHLGHGMKHARIEQFNFLCGFLGGRKYYLEKHRHMNVKQMHEHLPIRMGDAENWLICMNRAIDECCPQSPASERMKATFQRVAVSLVNEVEDYVQSS